MWFLAKSFAWIGDMDWVLHAKFPNLWNFILFFSLADTLYVLYRSGPFHITAKIHWDWIALKPCKEGGLSRKRAAHLIKFGLFLFNPFPWKSENQQKIKTFCPLHLALPLSTCGGFLFSCWTCISMKSAFFPLSSLVRKAKITKWTTFKCSILTWNSWHYNALFSSLSVLLTKSKNDCNVTSGFTSLIVMWLWISLALFSYKPDSPLSKSLMRWAVVFSDLITTTTVPLLIFFMHMS